MGCPLKVEVGEGEGLGLGVVEHLGQSGLAVVKVIPPDSDDGNVDEHDDDKYGGRGDRDDEDFRREGRGDVDGDAYGDHGDNSDHDDDGGQDVGGALQWDGKQIFGLVEGLWHVDCWLPHS